MHPEHKVLLTAIKNHAGNGTTHSASDSYLSSGHFYYSLSVPIKRTIAKEWLKTHKAIQPEDFTLLLNSLFTAPSYEEKTMAGVLLCYLPKQRKALNPKLLDSWLDNLIGWAEIDNLCQGTYTAKELLENWDIWENLLKQFATDPNISKRRAALVLLTGPVSESHDTKLETLAFDLIDMLKSEKDILLTKAISWLLRSMVKYHKEDVRTYLVKENTTLPKIAIRETTRKITTGRK